jgi:hypothetical protein
MSEAQNYIDLKTNGRLFPLWVMQNFKKYKLPPPGSEESLDSGARIRNKHDQLIVLRKYQAFLAELLSYKSKQKDILIYQGLGSGKTGTVINIYTVLFNFNPAWNVFLLVKASLKDDPWMKDLQKFLPKNEYDERMSNIKFVFYDAPNADKKFIQAVKESDSTKNNLYIFDEAHNFIRNVYSNLTSKSGKRALTIYEYIIQEKKINPNTRTILITGTPAVNEVFELALIYNLLRPDIFPMNEKDFKNIYITTDGDGNEVLNPANKNMFQRRILGLTSYYKGSDPKSFAKTTLHISNITMSPYQQKTYEHFETIEASLQKANSGTTVYKTYTRQSSNFVFPVMGELNGENRPRPSKFRLTDKEAEDLLALNPDMDYNKIKNQAELYLESVKAYISGFEHLCKITHESDIKAGTPISNDITKYQTFEGDFNAFVPTAKSQLFQVLFKSSCKITAVLFNASKSPGPFIIFSNFVRIEGLEMVKIYMKYFGYADYHDKSVTTPAHRYIEFHGGIEMKQRSINTSIFNKKDNIKGDVIKAVLIAPAGSEGINVKYTRQIHVLDPYWNEVRIRQLMGRGLRMDSHNDLPPEQRHIDIYRYHAVKRNQTSLTTDQKIYNLAEAKENRIGSFLDAVKEAAVDCELFKSHNMREQPYTCFKFNEKSYFDKFVGPAYKQDIFYDSKINDGLNASNSQIKNVKVYKVNGVILEANNKLSTPKPYWYNPKTLIMYDYDLEFPIGKVALTDGVPTKSENGEYIIKTRIKIPFVKNIYS